MEKATAYLRRLQTPPSGGRPNVSLSPILHGRDDSESESLSLPREKEEMGLIVPPSLFDTSLESGFPPPLHRITKSEEENVEPFLDIKSELSRDGTPKKPQGVALSKKVSVVPPINLVPPIKLNQVKEDASHASNPPKDDDYKERHIVSGDEEEGGEETLTSSEDTLSGLSQESDEEELGAGRGGLLGHEHHKVESAGEGVFMMDGEHPHSQRHNKGARFSPSQPFEEEVLSRSRISEVHEVEEEVGSYHRDSGLSVISNSMMEEAYRKKMGGKNKSIAGSLTESFEKSVSGSLEDETTEEWTPVLQGLPTGPLLEGDTNLIDNDILRQRLTVLEEQHHALESNVATLLAEKVGLTPRKSIESPRGMSRGQLDSPRGRPPSPYQQQWNDSPVSAGFNSPLTTPRGHQYDRSLASQTPGGTIRRLGSRVGAAVLKMAYTTAQGIPARVVDQGELATLIWTAIDEWRWKICDQGAAEHNPDRWNLLSRTIGLGSRTIQRVRGMAGTTRQRVGYVSYYLTPRFVERAANTIEQKALGVANDIVEPWCPLAESCAGHVQSMAAQIDEEMDRQVLVPATRKVRSIKEKVYEKKNQAVDGILYVPKRVMKAMNPTNWAAPPLDPPLVGGQTKAY